MVFDFFVAIRRRYECLKSYKNFKNCPKCRKKWLNHISEEIDTRSANLDTGTSLKQILIMLLIGSLCFSC